MIEPGIYVRKNDPKYQPVKVFGRNDRNEILFSYDLEHRREDLPYDPPGFTEGYFLMVFKRQHITPTDPEMDTDF
jgi:hypothetical protein